jgi:hypothetical protein
MTNTNSEPAFPCPSGHQPVKCYQAGIGDFTVNQAVCTTGITVRDYFAAAALQGKLASSVNCPTRPDEMATWAYRCADAMMQRRGS